MRSRSAYNPVASTDDVDDLEQPQIASPTPSPSNNEAGDNLNTQNTLTRPTTSSHSRGRRGPDSSRLVDASSKQEEQGIVNASSSLVDIMENESAASSSEGGYSDSDVDCCANISGKTITVVVLDSAQKRFPISVDPEWKVQTFKKAGAKVHKIAPSSQRLIFRGRMLDDGKTLKEMGIHQDDVIIHLFPKPRVILKSDSSTVTSAASTNSGAMADHESGGNGGGAHVPQIILDEAEQERRGQILVLGSYEIAEAQNNVRLLSLLLGTICVMRLLALLSIATGADEVPVYTDDLAPPGDGINSTSADGDQGLYPHVDYEPRTWQNQDYFDLVVSTVGFLVARLGMRATHENTSRLATQYLVGTMIAGILWNIWNCMEFVLFVEEESVPKDDDSLVPLTREDFRTIAIFTVVLPLGVWFLCCARAWQFRFLIEEAEQEAAERIRSELALSQGNASSDDLNEENARELDEISNSNQRPTIV